MPLNNKNLKPNIQNALADALYETQVSIFYNKCVGCSFIKIEARETTAPKSKLYDTFNNIESAVSFAEENDCHLHHQCVYPDGHEPYSLKEIVSNTCEFWNTDALNIQNETEYKPTLVDMEELNELFRKTEE